MTTVISTSLIYNLETSVLGITTLLGATNILCLDCFLLYTPVFVTQFSNNGLKTRGPKALERRAKLTDKSISFRWLKYRVLKVRSLDIPICKVLPLQSNTHFVISLSIVSKILPVLTFLSVGRYMSKARTRHSSSVVNRPRRPQAVCHNGLPIRLGLG